MFRIRETAIFTSQCIDSESVTLLKQQLLRWVYYNSYICVPLLVNLYHLISRILELSVCFS